MGRPRKGNGAKLVPVTTSLPPAQYDELERLARQKDVPLAVLLRKLLAQSVSHV
jgi:hypothetical protein